MPRLLLIREEQGHGGIQTVLQTLQQALVDQGWDITTLPVRPWRWGLLSLWRAWRLAREADVLLASNNFRPAYVAALLARLAGRPAVVWVHGPLQAVLGCDRPRTLKHRGLQALYRRCTLVCVSETSRASLLAWLGRPEPAAQVIRNPAPCPVTTEARPVVHDTAQTPAWVDLGFVGRLSKEKRPDGLLQMLRQLPAHLRLNVVGDGPLRAELQSAGVDLEREGRLRWLGALSVTPQTYATWQLTLLCSAYEGYPMVALESMAAGVPCVGTPLPALQEMLGVEGAEWLAAQDSPHALAQTVLRVLQTPPDSRRERALAIARRHDAATFGQQWHAVLLGQMQGRSLKAREPA